MSFVSGINLPWVTYGCDFGASRWRPAGGVSEPVTRRALDEHLARLAAAGHQVVRWFVLCDGRSGIRVDADGLPLGLCDRVRTDLDAAADSLERHGLEAIFVVFDFLLCAPPRIHHAVQMGGRRRWLLRSDGRTRLMDLVITPLVAHVGSAPSVAAWDIVNEPEWITWGFGGLPRNGAISRRAMRRFIGDAVAVTRANSPAPVTIGLASVRGLELVRDLGLDFFQAHWYDRHDGYAPLDTPVSEWCLNGPLLLGEYPTRGSHRTAADIVSTARRCGYVGALSWSALAGDDVSMGPGLETDPRRV